MPMTDENAGNGGSIQGRENIVVLYTRLVILFSGTVGIFVLYGKSIIYKLLKESKVLISKHSTDFIEK